MGCRSRRSRAGSRTHQGDRRHPGALRLSSYPCAVASGRVARESEASLPAVPRDGPAIDARVKAKLREDRQSATRSNETWAHDQLATGASCGCLRLLTRSRASRRRKVRKIPHFQMCERSLQKRRSGVVHSRQSRSLGPTRRKAVSCRRPRALVMR